MTITDPRTSDEVALIYRVADRAHFTGQALIGTSEVRQDIAGLNGATHTFTVHEGATRATLILRPQGEATGVGDLDLYVLGPDGEPLRGAAAPGRMNERLPLPGPLEMGTYTAWVYAASGVAITYTLELVVDY